MTLQYTCLLLNQTTPTCSRFTEDDLSHFRRLRELTMGKLNESVGELQLLKLADNGSQVVYFQIATERFDILQSIVMGLQREILPQHLGIGLSNENQFQNYLSTLNHITC